MFKGKLLENSLEETFAKKFIKNGDQIVCVCADSDGKSKGLMWLRFPPGRCDYSDYTYMHNARWDAVCFVAKRSVKFMGFGLLANYCGKDVKFIVQWIVHDEVSEEFEVSFSDD